MNELNHYSEEDFQNYFDKSFEGDVIAMESHVRECERCNESFKAYSAIWAFANNDLKVESLKIDLAYTVANKVFEVKESQSAFEKVMYGMLVTLMVALLYLCFKHLASSAFPTAAILLLIPFALFLWVNYKEIKILQQKFADDHRPA
jgi:hypothetical protein